MVKNLPEMQETEVQSLGQEDPLEKGMATHSSILAWRILWTEEPGSLQFMGSQRVRHDWVPGDSTRFHRLRVQSPQPACPTLPNTHTHTHTHTHKHILQTLIASPGGNLCFWLTGYRSELSFLGFNARVAHRIQKNQFTYIHQFTVKRWRGIQINTPN